jgi:small subunit ribosomal protein S17
MEGRGSRKQVTGVVVSDKMDKTITVEVDRLVKHPRYRKFVSRSSKYYAHDEKNDAGLGDTVEIAETRPLSKLKRWRLVRVVARAAGAEDRQTKRAEAGKES